MAEDNNIGRSPLRLIAASLLVIVIPLVVGLYAAPRLVPKPEVGIVRVNYDIFSQTAFELTEQLDYAREDDAIRAVVLIINSTGGSAAFSEELYLAVLNTRREIPVVASVDLVAASGAYYMAAAANEIYAKPTSSIGSVGVISSLPGEVFIEEDILTTGPFKAFGGSRDANVRQIERAKFAFLQAIATGRGDALEIDLDTLSRAEIYSGVQALDLGLIDRLAANDEAVGRAAELAGLSDYDVVELFPLVFDNENNSPAVSYQPPPIDVEKLWAPPTNLPPGLYYRYIETPATR